jgi:hypothetical protein
VKVDFKYLGDSSVRETSRGLEVAFAPNLARDAVFFDAAIAHPLRFREAIGALHEVVVGDLRPLRRDKSAYLRWKAAEQQKEAEIRERAHAGAKGEALARFAEEPMPEGLEADFRRMHGIYWRARRKWASEIAKSDPALFRALVPCDPVVSVAADAVFFECFSKDESSYAMLSVARDGFRDERAAGLGTTNVDYSIALYEQFQTLRSYRDARLVVDPTGFEVATSGSLREERIDLPASWLRGLGNLQAARTLPTYDATLTREALYSVLAHLKRHRERSGPRAIVVSLEPGLHPILTLEPWGVRIESKGDVYGGRAPAEVKVWGRRRLLTLARLLPLADRVDVRLSGSGLPSFWTVVMGEMRFTLALSGWTANDWTGSAALDLVANTREATAEETAAVARRLEYLTYATDESLAESLATPRDVVRGALYALARRGQAIYDDAAGLYRWRPILPVELSESLLGPEPEEVVEGRRLARERAVKIEREEALSPALHLLHARVKGTSCQAAFDADGAMSRAKCTCSFFHRFRMRQGPCRHLLALKLRSVVS